MDAIRDRAVLSAAGLALVFALAVGCNGDPPATTPDAGGNDGRDAGGDDATDAGGDADVSAEPNECGGGGVLEYDGAEASVGDVCGDCDDGQLACDGEEALECTGANPTNDCGGCQELDDSPGGDCQLESGVDGVFSCVSENDIECTDVDVDQLALTFETQPPSAASAGVEFDVELALVDGDGESVGIGGIELTLQLDDSEFADGTSQAVEPTDSSGVATFELTIEAAGDYVLTATGEYDDLDGISIDSDSFEVVAAEASAETSWISGEDGVVADGESEADVTVELADSYENPVSGVVPQFEASGEGNDYQSCSETDADGLANCSMTSTDAGEKTLQLTDPVELAGETIEFAPYWDCDADWTPFGGGTGSADDPHRICSPEQLNAIGATTTYLADHFVVTDDIDMAGVDDFQIIGDNQQLDNPERFWGTFDGNGHTISNLTIDRPSEDRVGMFGYTDWDATIENVTVENADITGSKHVGVLVGLSLGTIANCHTDGTVYSDDANAGGLAGRGAGPVENSSSSAEIIADSARRVGGLLGQASDDVISSSASGDVTAYSRGGGLVGRLRGCVYDSHATGNTTVARYFAGGLVGAGREESCIVRSYATGDAFSEEHGSGGLAGMIRQGSEVIDSYATGAAESSDDEIGGLVGFHTDGDDSSHITRSYSTAVVTGDSNDLGGLVGLREAPVNQSYWDLETSGVSTSSGLNSTDQGTGLYTSEFDNQEEFEDAGWDFDDVWMMGTAPDGETRPILQWQQQ